MDTRNQPNRRLKTQTRTNYLILYNTISLILWAAVLGRILLLVPLVGFENVYGGVGRWTKWTQTLALAEIIHATTGIVRAPILTTGIQVASRLLLVWPILAYHGQATQGSAWYAPMLLAWSVTEVVRYAYFALLLRQGQVPASLLWLRYNTFFLLYPLGVTSETALVYKASLQPEMEGAWQWALWAILALYVPGAYVLYTHMMSQRRKVLRGKGKERI